MADSGLFIGWSASVRGREETGLDVFNEALTLYAQLQEEGALESFETVLLGPHGGGLAGFVLIRCSAEQAAALRDRDDFARVTTRAAMVVDDLGVIDAAIGEGVAAQIGRYQEAIGALV
jgi:hypothetical protein